jgi:uncharacterized membrane protein
LKVALLSKIFKQIRGNIITGIILVIPTVATIYLVIKIFGFIDSILPNIFHSLLPFIPGRWIPGFGILVSLILSYFIGVGAKHYIGKKIIATANAIIAKTPVLNKIYSTLTQIMDSLSLYKKNIFEKVVIVEFPTEGCFSIGFITSESPGTISKNLDPNMLCVFIPTAPAPTMGFLLYLPRSKVHDTTMSVEEAVKAIMSAGLITGEQLKKNVTAETTPIHLKNLKWFSIMKRFQ